MKKIFINDNAVIVEDLVSGLVEFSRPADDCWYDEGYLLSGIINLTYNDMPSHRYQIGSVENESGVLFTEDSFREFAGDFLGGDGDGSGTGGCAVEELFDVELDGEVQITKTKSK